LRIFEVPSCPRTIGKFASVKAHRRAAETLDALQEDARAIVRDERREGRCSAWRYELLRMYVFDSGVEYCANGRRAPPRRGGARMRIEQLMTTQVKACRPEDTLERAAQLMWDYDCGSLPVCSGDGVMKVVGMITDRDIAMCAMFHQKPLCELPVSEAMARNLRTCRPTDSVEKAEAVMRDAQVRRLPVVDSNGRMVGMISLADLAREATQECAPGSSKEITETEVGDTLAAICEPPKRRLVTA
jgi:CBS domain-containing protein